MSLTSSRVSLVPFTTADFDLLAQWPDSINHAYLAGDGDFVTGAGLRARREVSGTEHLMIVTENGHRVGAVATAPLTYRGNVEFRVSVGDPATWVDDYFVDVVALLLTHLFRARNAHRVQTVVCRQDKRLVELLTDGCLAVEGVLRDYLYRDGEYHDAVVCALVRSAYYARGTAPARVTEGRNT